MVCRISFKHSKTPTDILYMDRLKLANFATLTQVTCNCSIEREHRLRWCEWLALKYMTHNVIHRKITLSYIQAIVVITAESTQSAGRARYTHQIHTHSLTMPTDTWSSLQCTHGRVQKDKHVSRRHEPCVISRFDGECRTQSTRIWTRS